MLDNSRTLNFALVGDVRSGLTVVSTALNKRPEIVCHAAAVHRHDDPAIENAVRRRAHEAYFGLCKSPDKFPTWLVRGETNPIQYIAHALFDNPQNGETVVGLQAAYPLVREWELDELFSRRGAEGDFCLIHLRRNPVACYVSKLQAERTQVFSQRVGEKPGLWPPAVSIDAEELIPFVRQHTATAGRLRNCCRDIMEVSYKDLFCDYATTMAWICEFLELDDAYTPIKPDIQRLANRPMVDRISNVSRLLLSVPTDVADFIRSDEFY